MAMFNFKWDLAEKLKEEEEERQRELRKKELLGKIALGGDATPQELEQFHAAGGKIDPLPSLTPFSNEAHDRNQLLQEEQAKNKERLKAYEEMLLLAEMGHDPSKFSTAYDTESRRNDLTGVLPELTPENQANALNKRTIAFDPVKNVRAQALDELLPELQDPLQKANVINSLDVSPYAANSGAVFNRFGGGITDESSAVEALANQRNATAGMTNLRADALEEYLQIPELNPLIKLDAANQQSTFKPARVKVRLKDGKEQHFNAVPNLKGGFDYEPVNDAEGAPLISEPAPGGGSTALQSDTKFISDTLGMSANEALLMKLQNRQKAPQAVREDIVARVLSANRYADETEIQDKAKQVWTIMRPGEPIPPEQPAATPIVAPQKKQKIPPGAIEEDLDDADDQEDARERAETEGYTDLGRWIPGQGWEVFKNGRLIGYYN